MERRLIGASTTNCGGSGQNELGTYDNWFEFVGWWKIPRPVSSDHDSIIICLPSDDIVTWSRGRGTRKQRVYLVRISLWFLYFLPLYLLVKYVLLLLLCCSAAADRTECIAYSNI